MIKTLYKYALIFLILSGFIFIGCSKNELQPDPDPTNTIDEIDKFIWVGLHDYYLWYKDVPALAQDKTLNELSAFLLPYNDHEDLFYDLLYQYGTIDKWSWIVDDYEELENSFQGISLSMGWDLGLVSYGDDNVFAYVHYVVPGSPAAISGIERGDIIYSINGVVPTLSNYVDLFFNTNNMNVGFATIVNYVITPIDGTKTLSAVEVHENPIYLSKTFDNVNGKKVGYLVYNAFRSNYDIELNDVFADFQGVDELIVDLRYNGGGAISSAVYLASMIHSTNINKLFSISEYNDKLHAYYLENSELGSNYNKRFFANVIQLDDEPNVLINSLNLSKVHFIVTNSSASASELLINALKPYMEVIIFGENTKGKYVGSFTVKDYIDNNKINPNHKWAMQPITFKISNSEGVSDFVNGLAPTYETDEDITNLIPFGDENEPMLKSALDYIKGITPSSAFKFKNVPFKKLGDSKDYRKFGNEMYVEDILQKK